MEQTLSDRVDNVKRNETVKSATGEKLNMISINDLIPYFMLMNSASVGVTQVFHFVILHGMTYLQRLSVAIEEKSRNKIYIILALKIKILSNIVASWSMTRTIIIIIS